MQWDPSSDNGDHDGLFDRTSGKVGNVDSCISSLCLAWGAWKLVAAMAFNMSPCNQSLLT